MEQLKSNFCVPYYIFEEIANYLELKSKGKNKSMKWCNIESLLKLAVNTNRLTKEQAKYIEKTFSREE